VNVEVRFFASLREATGTPVVTLDLPEGADFDALMVALAERLDDSAMTVLQAENVRLARNQDLVAAPFHLEPDDEVAFLPPVTGG